MNVLQRTQTVANAKAAVDIILAIANWIRDIKEIPSGLLYANVMGSISLADYEKIIAILVNADLVAKDASHLLRWVGPEVGA
jgi:hypothetical protein